MRRRKSPKPALPTLVAIISFAMPHAPAQSGRPPAIPFIPLATEIPITVTYRVQRSETVHPAPRAYNAPTVRPMSWTPSGARSAADFGLWTYERDQFGNWSSEFAQPRTEEDRASREWRYCARWRGEGVEIVSLHGAPDSDSSCGPPPEFVASLSQCAIPFLFAMPVRSAEESEPGTLEAFLSSLDAADAERTERGWQISAPVNGGTAVLSIEADDDGRLLRIEKVSVRMRHDGPVAREVVDVEEVRIVDGAQMPWNFTRTVYEGARIWERREYEVVEAVPEARAMEQASLR